MRAYITMSNHWHLVATPTKSNLSAFMAFLSSNVARDVNKIIERRGRFWEGRFSAQLILDEDSVRKCVEYVEHNPVKAGLCSHPAEWCGLSSAKQTQEEQTFEQLNTRAWERSSRSCEEKRTDYYEQHVLRLATPAPIFEGRVIDYPNQNAYERPINPKRSSEPLCIGRDDLKEAYRNFYRDFRTAHYSASDRFRNGDWAASFPDGSYRPRIPGVVGAEDFTKP